MCLLVLFWLLMSSSIAWPQFGADEEINKLPTHLFLSIYPPTSQPASNPHPIDCLCPFFVLLSPSLVLCTIGMIRYDSIRFPRPLAQRYQLNPCPFGQFCDDHPAARSVSAPVSLSLGLPCRFIRTRLTGTMPINKCRQCRQSINADK